MKYLDVSELLAAELTGEESPETRQLIQDLRVVRRRGYLTKREFLQICHWTSPRGVRRCESNSHHGIRRHSATALSSRSERTRSEALTEFHGVGARWARSFLTTLFVLTVGASAMAYESSYESTPVGTVEVKKLPAAQVLEAETPGDYFDRGNQAFVTLFRYIQRNQVSMTVPVEAEMKPGKMRFFIGRDVTRELPSGNDGVTVRELPARQVASVGIRGSYSRKNFDKGVADLSAWLAQHPEWIPAGDPYAVYWNSPFVPWFAKRSEIHIPVSAR